MYFYFNRIDTNTHDTMNRPKNPNAITEVINLFLKVHTTNKKEKIDDKVLI